MTDKKPITDADLAEVEAVARTLGNTGFPLKSEMLGLIERLRVAEAKADMLRVLQKHSTPNGLVVSLTQAVMRFIEFTSQYGDFRNGVTSPPDYSNGFDEGDHSFQVEVEHVRDALKLCVLHSQRSQMETMDATTSCIISLNST